MEELINEITKFIEERDWIQFHSSENLAKSISIEVGELLECFQWNSDYDINEVKDEFADVINYCLLLTSKLELNSEQIVLDKMKKTAKSIQLKRLKEKVLNMINCRRCICTNL